MKRTGKLILLMAAAAVGTLPLLSQTSPPPKLPFDVISIRPNAPNVRCSAVGGGFRGNRYTVACSTLRMLLQRAYQHLSTTPIAPMQVVGAPNWIDSDRYDVDARANCSGGALSSEQVQLMVRSMLEDRFQLKAHMETREGTVYNLVVAKYPPTIKPSEDQTPIPRRAAAQIQPCAPASEARENPAPPSVPSGQRGNPFDPRNSAPRGFVGISFSPAGVILRGSAVPISSMLGTLQRYVPNQIIDKTGLTGLFDFAIGFSQQGLVNPDGMPLSPPAPIPLPGATPGAAAVADPGQSLFAAIQELGLKLEAARGPVEVLVVDSLQKPTEN